MMAGSKVVCAPQATTMIHRAWSLGMGNAEELRSVADILQLEDQNIASMYAEKTGKTPADCLALMSAETWMSAEQAQELGFADEIARDDDGGGDDAEDAATSASAKAVLRIAATTQERIRSCSNAKVLLEQRQRIARASPGRTTQPRPAALKK
jgi:ATP-dependent protease ClpP protease subunit